MALSASTSRPLVVRVKRAADEECLDVIRLCPPISKIARGVNGAFSLKNLQFKHAGTITDKNDLPSRTAELVDKQPAKLEAMSVTTTVDAPSVSGVPSNIHASPSVPPLGSLRRNQRMYMIAKPFRPVSTINLDDIMDPWTRFYADDRENTNDGKRKHEDVDPVAESSRKNGFVLCDLETCDASPSAKKSKRTRREEPVVQCGSGITCNDEEMIAEVQAPPSFVYDVYTFSPHADEVESDSLYTNVKNAMQELDFILGTNADNEFFNEIEIESEQPDGNNIEEDDSNDEDNWRNDYPDEEDEDDSDVDGSGSGSSSDEEVNFNTGYGEDYDHSYGRRAHRSKQISDSDRSHSDDDENELNDDD